MTETRARGPVATRQLFIRCLSRPIASVHELRIGESIIQRIGQQRLLAGTPEQWLNQLVHGVDKVGSCNRMRKTVYYLLPKSDVLQTLHSWSVRN
jgi:hypothetical protein